MQIALTGAFEGRSGPMTIRYYAKLPTLADSLVSSNWLLFQYPDAYLYAVAAEAAKHLGKAEAAAQFSALRDSAVQDIRGDDHVARYSRARITPPGVTP